MFQAEGQAPRSTRRAPPNGSAQHPTLSEEEFQQFSALIYQIAGISMSPVKRPLVSSRLAKRLKAHQLASYGDYFRLITSPAGKDELQVAVDSLTTNETHFFREPKHFDFLRQQIIAARQPGQAFRIWSAACSSGEEPYSIAMVLADHLGDGPWEVVASDICTRVLEKARTGHYPMERTDGISCEHLSRYCLKGTGSQANTLLVDTKLRSRVNFMQVNLNKMLPVLGKFDLIFLRNVMIYFDQETKRQVVQRMLSLLKPGGHFLIGHSESLYGIADTLRPLAPSIYRKPHLA
jgi:chemotaxis protein methyltransferase CheR